MEELNVKPKNWKDLLDDTPFTRKDIIHLQDPLNLQVGKISPPELWEPATAGCPGTGWQRAEVLDRVAEGGSPGSTCCSAGGAQLQHGTSRLFAEDAVKGQPSCQLHVFRFCCSDAHRAGCACARRGRTWTSLTT